MNDRTLTDTQITAAFIARSEGSVSQDLAERIRAETSRTRQASRLVVLTGGLSDNANAHRLLWAAAISATSLALVGGLFFAGRQPDEQTSVVPPPSPSQPVASPPTPSADPSTSPLPSPSAEPTPARHQPAGRSDARRRNRRGHPRRPAAGPLAADGRRVVGEARAAPPRRGPPLCHRGVGRRGRLRLVPRPAGRWGLSLRLGRRRLAATASRGSRRRRRSARACRSSRVEMDSLGAYGGLACFGDNEIQLMGEVSCQTADVDLTIGGPSWLRGDQYCTFSGGDGSTADPGWRRGHPGPGGLNGIVTGHFADPQSSSCVWAVDPPAPDAAEITTTCRAMFVATDWKSVPID